MNLTTRSVWAGVVTNERSHTRDVAARAPGRIEAV